MKAPVDESKKSIAQNAAIAIAKQKSGDYDKDGKRIKPYADGRPASKHKFKKWNEETNLDEHDGMSKDERITAHKRLRHKHSSEGNERLAKVYDRKVKKDLGEDLRNWFRDRWVRMDTKGEIKGPCAREPGEGKPKCLPAAKAHAMDKEDRATAARRKRREDPVADRKGKGNKPVFVATEECVNEANEPTNPALWSRAKALAKQKFDVYPSAYANGWAAKWYKSKGGGWKSVNEAVNLNTDHYKALTDLELNTKNRDLTAKEDGYGPLNPLDAKGSKAFWEAKAKKWNTTVEAAKQSTCGNCAAFNKSKPVLDKIADGLGPAGAKIRDLADLGFCEIWEFKCAADRTCNVWLLGGPLKESKMEISEISKELAKRYLAKAKPELKQANRNIASVEKDMEGDEGVSSSDRAYLEKQKDIRAKRHTGIEMAKKKIGEETLEEGPKDAAGKDVFVKKIAKSAGVDYKAAGAIAAAAGRKRLGKAEFQRRVEAGQKAAAKARAKGQKYKG